MIMQLAIFVVLLTISWQLSRLLRAQVHYGERTCMEIRGLSCQLEDMGASDDAPLPDLAELNQSRDESGRDGQ